MFYQLKQPSQSAPSHLLSHLLITLLMTFLGLSPTAQATELVYTPINPLFGGNPLNFNILINTGNAQNPHRAPANPPKTALENFSESIERAILSKLAGEVTSRMFPNTGVLATGGTFDAGSFKVTVTAPDPLSNVVTITTTDKLTGATTAIEINKAMLSGM